MFVYLKKNVAIGILKHAGRICCVFKIFKYFWNCFFNIVIDFYAYPYSPQFCNKIYNYFLEWVIYYYFFIVSAWALSVFYLYNLFYPPTFFPFLFLISTGINFYIILFWKFVEIEVQLSFKLLRELFCLLFLVFDEF